MSSRNACPHKPVSEEKQLEALHDNTMSGCNKIFSNLKESYSFYFSARLAKMSIMSLVKLIALLLNFTRRLNEQQLGEKRL